MSETMNATGIVDANHALICGNVLGALSQINGAQVGLIDTERGDHTNRILLSFDGGRYLVRVEREPTERHSTADLDGWLLHNVAVAMHRLCEKSEGFAQTTLEAWNPESPSPFMLERPSGRYAIILTLEPS